MSSPASSKVHVPWSDAEAETQCLGAEAEAEVTSRSRRFRANTGWFIAAALISYAMLRLNDSATEGLFYLSVLVAAAIAYISAISGIHLRDRDWLLDDWKLRVGHAPLTAFDVNDLRHRAIASTEATTTLVRWINAGHHLRERDRRHIEAILAEAGIPSPRRPTSMSDLVMDVAE